MGSRGRMGEKRRRPTSERCAPAGGQGGTERTARSPGSEGRRGGGGWQMHEMRKAKAEDVGGTARLVPAVCHCHALCTTIQPWHFVEVCSLLDTVCLRGGIPS